MAVAVKKANESKKSWHFPAIAAPFLFLSSAFKPYLTTKIYTWMYSYLDWLGLYIYLTPLPCPLSPPYPSPICLPRLTRYTFLERINQQRAGGSNKGICTRFPYLRALDNELFPCVHSRKCSFPSLPCDFSL